MLLLPLLPPPLLLSTVMSIDRRRDVVMTMTTTPTMMEMLCNHENKNDVKAHLHGAAPRRFAAAAVQHHIHPVPRHRLHRLLTKLHPERR